MVVLQLEFRRLIRSVARSPVFFAVAIASIGLAVALNGLGFAFLEGRLLRPIAFPDAKRLVGIQDTRRGTTFLSVADFLELRSSARSFQSAGAYRTGLFGRAALTGQLDGETVEGYEISANVPAILGVPPIAGRPFESIDESGAGIPPVLVNEDLWNRHFPDQHFGPGHSLLVAGVRRPIIGIMPTSFAFPLDNAAFWTPLMVAGSVEDAHDVSVIARLRTGVTVEAAQSELDVIARRLDALHRVAGGHLVWAADLRTIWEPGDAVIFVLLQIAALCVLLVACTNVSALVLARVVAKRGELAVRRALGATPIESAAPIVLECVALIVVGCFAGLALCAVSFSVLNATVPSLAVRRIAAGAASLRLVGFAGACTVFGLAALSAGPILMMRRLAVSDVLRGVATSVTAGRFATVARDAIVLVQIVCAVVLTTLATTVAIGAYRARAWQPAFDAATVFQLKLQMPRRSSVGRGPLASPDLLLRRVASIPGVRAASLSAAAGSSVALDGRTVACRCRLVTSSYLRSLGVAMVRGRDLMRDDELGRAAAVVDERFAHTLWPSAEPLGQHLTLDGGPSGDALQLTVVGVTRAVAFAPQAAASAIEPGAVYIAAPPAVFDSAASTMLTIGGLGAPSGRALIAGALAEVDPAQPVDHLQSVAAAVDASLDPVRWLTRAFVITALIAGLIGLVGLYGSVASAAADRRREIALRVALGAESPRVAWRLFARSASLIAIGSAVGVVGAFFAARLLGSIVPGLSSGAPVAIASTTIATLLLGASSAWLPAWEASRVEPSEVLR